MEFKCDSCGYPLTMPGAVVISPPIPNVTPLTTNKFHVCVLCWVQKFKPLLHTWGGLPVRITEVVEVDETWVQVPCPTCHGHTPIYEGMVCNGCGGFGFTNKQVDQKTYVNGELIDE